MNAKVVIVLVALALVFIALVVWGAAREDEDSGGWTFDTLAGWAAGRSVRSTDFVDRADCFRGGVFIVAAGTPCVVEIRRLSGFALRHRQLTLALAIGLEVKAELAAKQADAPAVSIPLSTRMRRGPSLPVLSGGATLTLRCEKPDLATGQCRVQLAGRSG